MCDGPNCSVKNELSIKTKATKGVNEGVNEGVKKVHFKAESEVAIGAAASVIYTLITA
jgi:hypothetical protein